MSILKQPQRHRGGLSARVLTFLVLTVCIHTVGHAEVADPSSETPQRTGDEGFIFFRDNRGFSLIKVKDHFEYARVDNSSGHLIASGHVWGKADPDTLRIPPGIRFSSRQIRGIGLNNRPSGPKVQSTLGDFPLLVIPIRFADHGDRDLPDPEIYERILNREGGDPEFAPGGSVRDYLREVSYDRFRMQAHVLSEWVDLPETEAHYASESRSPTIANGLQIDEAIHYALDVVDTDYSKIDLSRFDRNDDGYLDAVGFIHSGYGSESGGLDASGTPSSRRIHSMQYSLPEWTGHGGHKVRKVAVISGLFGRKGNQPGRVGVLAHEGLHMASLPDLYVTSSHYENRVGAGIGYWGILGDSWGVSRDQKYPLHLSPWGKVMLDWVRPILIDRPGRYTVRAVEKYDDIYVITHGFPDGEYLLIENRQPIGFDREIPAGKDGHKGGLAIWHIDDRKIGNDDKGFPGAPGFPFNNAHFRVALLQADGNNDLERGTRSPDGLLNHGDGDDLFRATSVSELGPETNPGTRSYQLGVDRDTGVRIYDISPSRETMSFRVEFLPVDQPPPPDRLPDPGGIGLDSRPAQPEGTGEDLSLDDSPQDVRSIKTVSFSLKEPTKVILSGTAVVRSNETNRTVEIALSDENMIWKTSRRRDTVMQRDASKSISTGIVREYPVGDHQVHLVLRTPEGDVQVQSETSLTHHVLGATGDSNAPPDTEGADIDSEAPRSARRPFLTYIDLSTRPADAASTRSPTTSTTDVKDVFWEDLGGVPAAAFTESGPVGSITFELGQPARVRVTSTASFASPAPKNAFSVVLEESGDPDPRVWTDSRHEVTTEVADQCAIARSRSIRQLPAGKHTITWRILPDNETATYAIGGGIITVEILEDAK